MDLLSPLSRLLGFSRLPTGNATPSSSRDSLRGSLGKSSSQSAAHSPNVPPDVLTQTTSASAGEQNLLAQLRALSPQALQRFVTHSLPFLDDPRFAIALARATRDVQQHSRRQGARVASSKADENAPTDNKLKAARPPAATLGKVAESYQLRDQSGVIWRVWFLPIALEGRLERIGIYYTPRYRSGREQGSDKGSDKDTNKRRAKPSSRLVFAIEFAHTGPLEIEAEHSEDRLRVAIRATSSFSLAGRAGIRARFLEILDDLGLQGQIVFHRVDSLPMGSLSASAETTEVAAKETTNVTTKASAKVTTWEMKL